MTCNILSIWKTNDSVDQSRRKGVFSIQCDFEEFGGALVDARDQGTAVDLRFEIDPDESSLFAMPIELLNREGTWQGFFCRITAMARGEVAQGP